MIARYRRWQRDRRIRRLVERTVGVRLTEWQAQWLDHALREVDQ